MQPQFESGDEKLYRVVGYRVEDNEPVFLSNTYNTLGKAKAKRTLRMNDERRRVNDYGLLPAYRRIDIQVAEIQWSVVDIDSKS